MSQEMPNEGKPPYEEFGLRLTIAAMLRFSTLGAFKAQLARSDAKRVGVRQTLYSHAAGKKWPDNKEIVNYYEDVLRVPRGWLETGSGETIQELREAEIAVKARDHKHSALERIITLIDAADASRGDNVVPINQEAKRAEQSYGKFSQIRHIPILTAVEIIDLLAGRRTIEEMSTHTLPIGRDDKLGPNLIVHTIADNDLSMTTSAGQSIPPGTPCMIDLDREIQPGDFVLVRNTTDNELLLRRYKAARPLGVAQTYSLEALNPSFEPIRVSDPKEYQKVGRLVMTPTYY